MYTLRITRSEVPLANSPGKGGGITYSWHIIRPSGHIYEVGLGSFYTEKEAHEDATRFSHADGIRLANAE